MIVTYLHPLWGQWAQYDRHQAGYYRGGRRARRLQEIAARAAGSGPIPKTAVSIAREASSGGHASPRVFRI
jgi:hypothetical protein